jgi:hypothetical protein
MNRLTGVVRWLDWGVFACLLVAFALAPHTIKGAARVCTAGTVLFGVSLFLGRRFKWHELFRPVLVFLLLATISTTFSSAPDWSWRRLAWFSLMLSVIVAARTIRTRGRVIAMVCVLLLSSASILVRTGWQYTHGIGVRLEGLAADNPLALGGLQPNDVIQTLNGRATRSPGQFEAAVKAETTEQQVVLGVARGAPIQRVMLPFAGSAFQTALHAPGVKIERGHPQRAQAGFYHYVPFAGFMCVVALLAWGLALTSWSVIGRLGFVLVFAGAGGAVAATLTRTYLLALLLGAFAAFWIVSRRRARVVAPLVAVMALIALTLWIHRERGLGWVALDDAGTQYRVEMWRDGLHLIREHPLLGIGLDAAFSGKWDLSAYRKFPLMSHFHSTPIQLAVDAGLPTLAAWLWIAVVLFRVLVRTWRRLPEDESWLRGVVLGVLASAVAFYAASLAHYNQGDGEVMILMSVLMGIAVAVDGMAVPGMRVRRESMRGAVEVQRSPVAKIG